MDVYIDAQFSIWEIVKKINRSSICVYNYLKLGINYEKKHYSGGNWKLTRLNNSHIFKEIINNDTTAAQGKRDLQLPVTTQRVQQILHNDTCLKWT